MIKVVITGAGGFLGSNLIKRLENNKDVIVYGFSSKEGTLNDSSTKFVHKDIIDSNAVKDILVDAIVINCAFPRNSAGIEMADGLSYINRLFLVCRKYKAKAIINISSQSVYSQKRHFMADENTEICLETPYAVGKYATELMLQSICDGSELVYTNLRMASLIGPGFDQRIVNRLVKKAIEMEPITISVSEQRFGFLDVLDAVDAIILLIFTESYKWQHVYNIGNEKAFSLVDIIKCIRDIFDKKSFDMPTVSYVKEEKTGSTAVSYQRLHNDTGYEPKITLNMSIKYIYDKLKMNI